MQAVYEYPSDLPVVAHRTAIIAALRRHPVVIVCGETGSGKTTQLPKMAMEAGFGANGRRIACTQPRRLAAVTVAERVAAETHTEIGGLIGYQHRFGRKVSRETRVKFMTDGVLLAETRGDSLLKAYDVIIVDEAHERSLNVDFLLGILKRILERRRDLKVIVSSATLDTERFSAFFDHAPTLTIPGRLFPITTRYLAPAEGEESDLARDVTAAVAELPPRDDILVFLPGERDIRETAEALQGVRGQTDDIIPLLASLPAGEQQRAFRPSSRRRIVLATNVAETSVTIPGIRAVIDSGLVRLSRYVHRTQVQRLQIEPVSQASARQRMGRCGRLGPGTCIRLYSEEDYNARESFTPPEVLRSSLAGVILTMLDLRLGDIARFPFIDPPRPAMVAEGLRELIELGAIARDGAGEPCLSPIGRKLARIPIEPRLARMLLAASERAVLPRVLPIVAALSCDDPRRRPVDEREKATQAHAPFRVPESDFTGTLKLWDWWCRQRAELSQTRLRKLCKATYLSYPKMREWGELTHQLETLSQRLGLDLANDTGDQAALHSALLSGLLGRVGHFDPETRDYRGARGLRFVLHPGSALRKKPPEWIVAGELVDTERLFARTAAALDVRWIEPVARGICKSHCHSPEWDARSGFVRGIEQVTLYGLVIVPSRRCDYSRVDPVFAREIFIRRGLVDGEFPQPPPEVRQNTALLDALRRHVEKLRRRELFDSEGLIRHFNAVLPAEICSAPALKKWLRCATREELSAFRLKKSDWWPSETPDSADFPESITIGAAKMRLSYRHTPDDPETDGITCTVRKGDLGALRLWRADWLVPGALPEKLTWMISVLPSAQRRVLTPIADTVSGLLAKLKPGTEPLADAVVKTVYAEWGFRLSAEAWTRATLPQHLRVRYVVKDEANGRTIAASRDLEEVLKACGAGEAGVRTETRDVHTSWDFGEIPERQGGSRAGWSIEHYPALCDRGNGVSIALYATPETAARVHATGVTRLYLLALGEKARLPFKTRALQTAAALYLKESNYTGERISGDILAGAVRETFVAHQPPVRTADEFARRLVERRGELNKALSEATACVTAALNQAGELLNAVESDTKILPETAESLQTQIAWLTCPGFPRITPHEWLREFQRYLKGAAMRLARARVNPLADRAKEARFAPFWARYQAALAAKAKDGPTPETLQRYRWMLEEFRISIFAQELHTREPVSEKRLDAILAGP